MTTRTLQNSPILPLLYARAAATLIPGAGKLPGIAGGGGVMPQIQLSLPNVEVKHAALDAYREVCGFGAGEQLPSTYPHILAFPLHMAVMTDSGFPYSPIGLVHIENEIVQHRPIGNDEPLDLRVSLGELLAHPRGRAFELITVVSAGGSLVWEERSKMLRRGGGSQASAKPSGGEGEAEEELGGERAEGERVRANWDLPGDLGRSYASVSGDRNPIHLHPLSARLFGFPRAIAHGMWTLARSIAELQKQRLPDSCTIQARFRKPVLLPAEVRFESVARQQQIDFRLTSVDGRQAHLEGTVKEQ